MNHTGFPAAKLGATVLGVDIASNLVAAGRRRAAQAGLAATCTFLEGDACRLSGIENKSFDLVISMFGVMFAPKPFDVAREMVRVTKLGGRIVMGNWIPNDPTLMAQMLNICAAYSPPPPEGFVSPMLWGSTPRILERFGEAHVASEAISWERAQYVFDFKGSPTEFVDAFLQYYGPKMNALEAATRQGREKDLRDELVALVNAQNRSQYPNSVLISSSFLQVTVDI